MMGQGRGRGRRKGRKKRMLGFLQPCLLVQLAGEDRHGYDLYLGLAEFIEDAPVLDPSMIYRQMRELEENGCVRSYEGDVSLGPKRKMYALTDTGRQMLEMWAKDMERTKREIDRFLALYDKNSSDTTLSEREE